MTNPIRTAMEAAIAWVGDHPDEARYTDSLATARVVEGLRIRVEGPNGEALETDMPAGVGGSGVHPSPGWFMRAAVASRRWRSGISLPGNGSGTSNPSPWRRGIRCT